MSATLDEVLGIEKGFWTEANNPDYFNEHMADDAITVIEPMGFIEKHQAVSMSAEEPWQNVQMSDVVVRELTPDCVIVAYHGQGQHGTDQPYRGSIVSTYIRRDGRWQLALTAHQPWAPSA